MPESSSDHKELIAGLPFMLPLDDSVREEAVDVFGAVSKRTLLERETLLFLEGDSVTDYGYILISGQVAVRKKDGSEIIVSAPVVLGEMKQFSLPGMRTATVVVTKDAEVLLFTWDTLYATLGERLSEGDISEFRAGLKKYAWQHFFGDDM